MKDFRALLPALFAFTIISSCNNDLDIIDDYREVNVVYGLLNYRDSTQYVRVQKSYLGEGNAYIMGQVADSIYNDTAAIEVRLEKTIPNGKNDIIRFVPAMDIPKQEGLFTNYPHVVYKSYNDPNTFAKEDSLDRNATYRLIVTNKRTGVVMNSETKLVQDILLHPSSPLPYSNSYINLSNENPFKIQVITPEFTKIVNLKIRFNYTEFTNGSNFFENKSLELVKENFIAASSGGNEVHIYELAGDDFFSWLKSKIPNDPTKRRPASLVTLDFIFTSGAEEFYNYYAVNNNSATLNDIVPVYSNITNGLGLFSSRNTRIYPDKAFNTPTLDSLANGRFTGNLFE